MIYEAHRGVSTDCPENTLAAFRAAIMQGYGMIETDPALTKDAEIVLFHDKTLNRVARLDDGEKLPCETALCDIPLQQARTYDVGIGFSLKYRGERIPLLSELLALVRDTGVAVKLDSKINRFDEKSFKKLIDVCKTSGAKVVFTATTQTDVARILSYLPDADIAFDGDADESVLRALAETVKGTLTVWAPIDSPATAFSAVPKLTRERAALIRKYAKLGVWILTKTEEEKTAEALGADIVETTGAVKPHNLHKTVDMHVHTTYSHDSKCSFENMREAMKAQDLDFSMTNHFDNQYVGAWEQYEPNERCYDDMHAMGAVEDGVFTGVEIGEAIWNKTTADKMRYARPFDVIIGSAHAVRFRSLSIPLTVVSFDKLSEEKLHDYLAAYFNDMLATATETDIDILAHLTVPLRYISGQYKIPVDVSPFYPIIDKILEAVIARGIALEVNTSCLGTAYDELLPNEAILARYRALGGVLLTLGSDAHAAAHAGWQFAYTKSVLCKLGFTKLFYFKDRIPIPYDI